MPQTPITAQTTPAAIKRLPKGRHPVNGAKGLALKVIDERRRYWAFRYTFNGKESELSLGPWPEMPFGMALASHAEKRARLLKGENPRGDRLARWGALAARKSNSGLTFKVAAERWLTVKSVEWDPKTHAHIARLAETYCAPIHHLPVEEITRQTVCAILEPIWLKIPGQAKRVRLLIERTLDYAYVLLGIEDNVANPARWKGKLALLLPSLPAAQHHRALDYKLIPPFIAFLYRAATAHHPGHPEINSAARMSMFLILTGTRSDECRSAPWSEFENRVWTITAERMKSRRPHRVPLCRQVLAILQEQARIRTGRLVFPGRSSHAPFCKAVIRSMFARAGVASLTTIHGLRASFRSWAKSTGEPFEVCEEALAHLSGGKTVKAYDRDDMLELRGPLMQRWADYAFSEAMAALPSPSAPLLLAPPAAPPKPAYGLHERAAAGEQAILVLIGERGAMSLPAIVAATGAPSGTVYYRLRSLQLRGALARGPGGWTLPPHSENPDSS